MQKNSFFFVSYTAMDEAWATWIGAQLEAAGQDVRLQAWDSPAGTNFIVWISEQMRAATRTIAVCSPAYLASHWCTQEWSGALAGRTLIPLRVTECILPPVLATISWRDLHGVDEAAARRRLLEAVGLASMPRVASAGFPGTAGGAPFPGVGGTGHAVQYDTPMAGQSLQPLPLHAPRELPLDVSAFMGRADELEELNALLAAGQETTAVVISAVSGTAGVGKTALAVHWAHRVAARFPDGQLYVDLRGYDPDQPVDAGEALVMLLRALGVDGADIPHEVAERAARYRTLLAKRRILLVLDNASSVEQVRLLLPGSSSCIVVVTSRDSLPALVARYGARRIDLDLLPMADAVALLRVLIGDRVEAEPHAATALAEQCARLPLALRVAAELAATRPATSLTRLVDELADEQRRLILLDAGGDPRTAVRAVFSWSYRHLPADAAAAFRLLGLRPGPDLDVHGAAALAGITVEEAQRLLGLLTRTHLIQPIGAGRYIMHDLLRAYAADLTTVHDGEENKRVALTRLFDHYLATAAAAMDALYPSERHRRPRIPPAEAPIPLMTDAAVAMAWLDAERRNLVAACAHTAAYGWPSHTTRLAMTLSHYLWTGGHYSDALAIHAQARQAAHGTGEQAAEAQALTDLGLIYLRQGHHEQAADHLQQATAAFRQIGDRAGEARALSSLGRIGFRQGRYEQAVDSLQQALALFRDIGDDFGQANALTVLGWIYEKQGPHRDAAEHQQQALVLFRQIGDRAGEARALGSLGFAYGLLGRYQEGIDHLQQALALYREIGIRADEPYSLHQLGIVFSLQGRHRDAAEHQQQALVLFRQIGDRAGEIETLNGLGEALFATGQPDEAHRHHTIALALATETGDRYEQARAHNGHAHIHHAAGRHDQARYHWQTALAHYTAISVPEAEDVRTLLDQTADGSEEG